MATDTETKHTLAAQLTVAEARRFEALANERFGIPPAALLRRLMLAELARTRSYPLSVTCPDTVR